MLWRSSAITQKAAVTTRIHRTTGGAPAIGASFRLMPSTIAGRQLSTAQSDRGDDPDTGRDGFEVISGAWRASTDNHAGNLVAVVACVGTLGTPVLGSGHPPGVTYASSAEAAQRELFCGVVVGPALSSGPTVGVAEKTEDVSCRSGAFF